jgi:pimeloyl-ACP methyl ester carboxylesterase
MQPMTTDVALSTGRIVDVLRGGAATGPALVMHHGTPLDATIWNDWDGVARDAGLQLVALSRPGYARSTRRPGRIVADVASDVVEILARGDVPWFVTVGWSGGGPHALACAALLPACRAAATIAGVAPYGEAELDFLAGMGPENVAEFGAALAGESTLRAWMNEYGSPVRSITGATLAAELGGLAPQADRDVLTGDFADHMAGSMRRALAAGFDGWIDDDLAFTTGWGFDLRTIRVPVSVWQGDLDLMVPLAHGRRLAETIPGAQAKMVEGHGHISLRLAYREQIVNELLATARV